MGAQRLKQEAAGLVLLASVTVFNLVFLAPEMRIGRFPPNDNILHLAAAERLGASLTQGEPFLEPWVSEWSLGFPFWRSYQPLPHLIAAGALGLGGSASDHAAVFALLHYLFMAFLPVSVYAGARMLGIGPVGAGLGAILCVMPSSFGEYGRYGLGYGATTWRGSGLFTQAVALHFLSLSIGAMARALDTGMRRAGTAALVAATALSHIVFGYVVFASAGLLALVGPKGERPRRLVRLAIILISISLLLLWFVVPLALSGNEINHSRWEAAYKWDSFGAPEILREISRGRFFDAGRAPILSLLVLAAAIAAALRLREPLPRRLLALTLFWLGLYFGRSTWGHLLLLVGIPPDLHLHRLQAAFELSAMLLTGWGISSTISLLAKSPLGKTAAIVVAAAVATGLAATGSERARYLNQSTAWGEDTLRAVESERGDIEDALDHVRSILVERPGRVSAGKAATWGRDFKVGSVPFYAFLTRQHFDQVSFLYHSMSLTSDIMVLRDESNGAQDVALGVRAVVAPAGQAMPPHLRLRGTAGRFAVYESSSEGYFGLVDIAGRLDAPASARYDASSRWLTHRSLRQGVVYALDASAPFQPAFGRWQPLPEAPAEMLTPRGRVVSESKDGETYRAQLDLERPCHAFVKVTWHPDLIATVDGQPAPLIRVTPGFGAVGVSAGPHEVVVRYAPGPLKPVLFWGGLLSFAGMAVVSARRRRAIGDLGFESFATERLTSLGARLATPRVAMALWLLGMTVLGLRPLLRGRLIEGHDATEYPPRLVEFARAVSDGQVPPIWAPDLGSGHGQPLFEFGPPLVYAAALPFHRLGLRLADCLQLGLFVLHLAGAIATYRIGRMLGGSREASAGVATAWLFVPYLALDLFVRTAFAESAAFALAPVALFGILRAVEKPSATSVALGAVGVSLVTLSHNAAALLLAGALALIVVARALDRPTGSDHSRGVISGFAGLALGLGLSAFFWLPAMAEKQFVKVELLREGFLHWREHAISPLQLIWGRWRYGLSTPGTADGMSFAIGPVHLALAAAGLTIVLRRRSALTRTYVAMAAAALGGAFLATDWSSLIWERVTTLQYFAYPWRALFLPGLLLPILALPVFERLSGWSRLALVGLLLVFNLPHTEPKGYLTFDDEYYEPASIAKKGLNTSTREEYEPRWVESRPPYSARRLTAGHGSIDAREIKMEGTHQEWVVSCAVATEVEAHTFYYPGWKASIDGTEVPITPVPVRGTMSFTVPAGEHRVVLELERTPLRRNALLTSAATALGLGLWMTAASLRRRRRGSA